MLPAGIEPTLQAPQACVLSIERRERMDGMTVAGIVGNFQRSCSRNEAIGTNAQQRFLGVLPRAAYPKGRHGPAQG